MYTENKQLLIDVAIQNSGSAESLYELCKLNNLLVTDIIEAGSLLIYPKIVDRKISKYFVTYNIKPATYGQYIPSQNYVEEYISTISNYQIPQFGNVIQVLNGQSLFDFSIEHLGSAQHAYQLAKVNNKSVSEMLQVGEVLQLPKVEVNTNIVTYFTISANKPATAGTYTEVSQGDYYHEEYDNQEYSI